MANVRDKTTNKSALQNAMEDTSTGDIISLLEDYHQQLDLEEVKTLVLNTQLSTNVRHAAYLYLVAHAPLATLQQLSSLMNFHYTDSLKRSVAHVALLASRQDVLAWLGRDHSHTLRMTNKHGQGLVLNAVDLGSDMFDFLIRPVSAGGLGLPHDEKDDNGNNAVLTAVARGRIKLLRKILTLRGMSFKSTDICGNNAVLVAIANGQMDTLLALVRSKKRQGFGLSLKTRDDFGTDSVLTAIANGETTALRFLLLSEQMGGGGFSLKVKDKLGRGPAQVAIVNHQAKMLALLLSMNVSLPDMSFLIQHAKDITLDIFLVMFTHLWKSKGCLIALAWANEYKSHLPDLQTEINIVLKTHCEAAIDFIAAAKHSNNQIAILEAAINTLEEIVCGEGRFRHARLYAEYGNYIEAFQQHESVLQDDNCPQELRERASFELANLVFNGHVVITNDQLDINASEYQSGLDDEQRQTNGRNPEIMQERAINAAKYLSENDKEEEQIFRDRLNIAEPYTNRLADSGLSIFGLYAQALKHPQHAQDKQSQPLILIR